MYRSVRTLMLVAAASSAVLFSGMATAQHVDPNTVGTSDSRVPQDQQNYMGMTSDVQKAAPARSLKERIASEGGILLSKAEVRDHLAGNTQQWSNGGAHYASDGSLTFIWEGNVFSDYSWKVRGQGRVCITNNEGFTTSCSLYFRHKGSVWTVVTEEFGERRDFFGGPDTILVGKKLADLEPWDAALQ